VLSERFEVRPDFSLREFIERSMKADDTIAARVWFATAAIDRARRESYASFETERSNRGGVEIELRTFSLEWLARWVLSFGREAEALAPHELRERVRDEAEAVALRYRQRLTAN
jgi:predicted DNA-binding transcriptional regulator YafY